MDFRQTFTYMFLSFSAVVKGESIPEYKFAYSDSFIVF